MSSGKPQTRGLAALLRIEKERREREEAGAEEAAAPPPPGETGRPEASPQVQEHLPDAGAERPVESRPASPEHVSEKTGAVTASTSDVDQAEGGAASAASLPRPRPAAVRPVGAARKKAGALPEPTPVTDPGWEKFAADWKPFLREGVKFKLCEFFYRNTVALGRREFTTSTAQLSRVSGAHRRHIFLVLRQLEELRFIRKESVETNRKDEGLVISFYPDRQA